MNCPNCNTELKAGTSFCIKCGYRLTESQKNPSAEDLTDIAENSADVLFCPKCGRKAAAGRAFCSACGAKIPVKVSARNPYSDSAAETKAEADEENRSAAEQQTVPIENQSGVVMHFVPAEASNGDAPKDKRVEAAIPAETKRNNKHTGRTAAIILILTVVIICGGVLLWYHLNPMSAHKILTFLPCPHDWMEATCILPETCNVCGEQRGEALGHDWIAAECETPEYCSRCGETGAAALGHNWSPPTCTEPATCTECGATDGNPFGHSWLAATYTSPQTCKRCGATVGSPLTEPIYLTSLRYTAKYGKLFLFADNSNQRLSYASGGYKTLSDYTKVGYFSEAKDMAGNYYTCGIMLDGLENEAYWAEYDIGGKYTLLTGWCAPSSTASNQAAKYYAQFKIYGDGVLLYTSPAICKNDPSEEVSVDVTGVNTLKLEYVARNGNNEIATFFDPLLQ